MKNCLVIILVCISQAVSGQSFYDLLTVTSDVVLITQINYNGALKRSGWKSLYSYEEGNLAKQVNYYKGDLRLNEHYDYEKSKDSVIIKQHSIGGQGYFITKEYYSNNGKLTKKKVFLDRNLTKPNSIFHSYVYDSTDRLISFKITHYWGRARDARTDCTILKYTDNTITIQRLDSCHHIRQTETNTFDSKGNLVKRVIDAHDPNAHVSGGRSENGIQHYHFKYDKRGNWVKRYYVTSKGKKILEIKRRVRYQ